MVSVTQALRAVAIAAGLTNSAIGSAAYTINASPSTAAPVASIASGTYNNTQMIALSDATSGAVIYYTVNGVTPTVSSTKYTSPISVEQSETLQMIAMAPGDQASPVSSATYTLTAATPVISPSGGVYSSPVSVTITTASSKAVLFYTTNGSIPNANSTKYTGPITVAGNETIRVLAEATGYAPSIVVSGVYSIEK